MTPGEYEAALLQFNMTPREFAEMVGVSWRHGERYRDDTATIPDPVAKLIRTILRHALEPEDVG
jgi:ParB-like chromosome segregation protein Spo0J